MKKNILFGTAAAAMLACLALAGCGETPASSTPASSQQDPSSEVSSTAPAGDFDTYFNNNPLDADHQGARSEAFSTYEMLSVETHFAEAWKTECESAYEKLLDAAPSDQQASIEQFQQQWSSQLPARLDNIASEVQATEGSLANLQGAIKTSTLYRDHAKELYQKLYEYDQNFTFAYEDNQDNQDNENNQDNEKESLSWTSGTPESGTSTQLP